MRLVAAIAVCAVAAFAQQPAELALVGAGGPGSSGPVQVFHTAAGGTLAAVTTTPINSVGSTLEWIAVSSAASCSFSDSLANSWSTGPSEAVSGIQSATYYKFNPTTSSSQTFTCTGGASGAVITAIGWSGAFLGSLDGSAKKQGVGSATSIQPSASLTPGGTFEVCPIVLGVQSGATTPLSISSPFSPYTDFVAGVPGVHAGGASAWTQPSSPPVALQPTWNWTGSVNAVTILQCYE